MQASCLHQPRRCIATSLLSKTACADGASLTARRTPSAPLPPLTLCVARVATPLAPHHTSRCHALDAAKHRGQKAADYSYFLTLFTKTSTGPFFHLKTVDCAMYDELV